MKFKTNFFEIEFIESIKLSQFFLYKIKIFCYKDTVFEPSDFRCNAGINCLHLNLFCIDNIKLLRKVNLNKNDELIGYIAFQKTNISTNQPTIIFNSKKFKIKDEKGKFNGYNK